MEIKSVSQGVSYHSGLNEMSGRSLSQFSASKLDRTIFPKEDMYSHDFRTVAMNIDDLNAPLSDSGYGGG